MNTVDHAVQIGLIAGGEITVKTTITRFEGDLVTDRIQTIPISPARARELAAQLVQLADFQESS